MNIFAIETSCDETSAAVIKNGREILSNVVASQINLHSKYGGVVPEVAARAHVEKIIPVIESAREQAGMDWSDIDKLAVVEGAGLLPALLVGVNTAKSLALALHKPLIPVNHIVGHIYANWLGQSAGAIKFPLIALVVSGGHSELLLMRDHWRFQRLGGTLDDAAGEAFDKVASLLELGYPGGPIISQRAEQGNPRAFDFPRALLDQDNFDFSFSGLKTAVIYQVRALQRRGELSATQIDDLCASFQQAAVDALVEKSRRAIKKFQTKTFLLAGGVAANKRLRETLQKKIAAEFPRVRYHQPEVRLCMDNGAMIGAAAYFMAKKFPRRRWDWKKLEAVPGLRINSKFKIQNAKF
jgi:N6-L-threonylcarbamoyladenine synthase